MTGRPRPGSPGAGDEVLVVDDDDAVRRVTLRILERAGFVVLDAADGARAIEVLDGAERELAALVCDLEMPHIGGLEVAERFHERHPHGRAVLMSGTFTVTHDLRKAEDGRTVMLAKPFTEPTLLAALRGYGTGDEEPPP